ncbi:hypothetical protein ABZZ80_47985, partial [Streptomyces sp. NPDC006356]
MLVTLQPEVTFVSFDGGGAGGAMDLVADHEAGAAAAATFPSRSPTTPSRVWWSPCCGRPAARCTRNASPTFS